MTDTIDTFNNEINGGAKFLNKLNDIRKKMPNVKLPNRPNMPNVKTSLQNATKYINKKAANFSQSKPVTTLDEYGKAFFSYASDFYVALFILNFIARLIMALSSLAFEVDGRKKYYIGQYKKHVRESFGVTIILTIIFAYMHLTVDKATLRGKNNDDTDCIQFTIFTLILFSIFMYDYVNIVLMLVKKKFFSKDKKNHGILSGIMLAIIVGMFVLYYMTIVLAKGMPINPFSSENFHPFLLGSGLLVLLFSLSILGFFIIYPNINEIQKSQLSNNNNDRKEFFIDMFKKYYMVFILISCILLVVLHLNYEPFYTFIGPCPEPEV